MPDFLGQISNVCGRLRACLALLTRTILLADIGGPLSDRIHPSLPSIGRSVASKELAVSVIYHTDTTIKRKD